MRHYTPIDTAVEPVVEPHYGTGVIDVTLFHAGSGETTIPLPMRYAADLATRVNDAVLAVRNFHTHERTAGR